MLDDDTASLVIEKQLGLGLSNCISNSRGQPTIFSDAASRVAASQSKSAIGGFTFDSSLFEDRRTPESSRGQANSSSNANNPNVTSISSNGHLIEIVQSNSEMKAANAMLAMAKVAAANNAAANNSNSGVHQHSGLVHQQMNSNSPAGRLILDTTDNGSDTASDEEMEHHMAAAEMNKQTAPSSMIMNHQQSRGGTSGSNVMSAPTVGVAAPSADDDENDEDNDKPLNLSATSTVGHSSTATSSATTSSSSGTSSSSTTTTSRVYQASNQQIIDIYIDKFLNTGMVCNSNGYANQANAPRQKGMLFKNKLYFYFNICLSFQNIQGSRLF